MPLRVVQLCVAVAEVPVRAAPYFMPCILSSYGQSVGCTLTELLLSLHPYTTLPSFQLEKYLSFIIIVAYRLLPVDVKCESPCNGYELTTNECEMHA